MLRSRSIVRLILNNINNNNTRSIRKKLSSDATTTPVISSVASVSGSCPADLNHGAVCAPKQEIPENWDDAKPFESVPGPKPLPLIGNSLWFVFGKDFVKLSLYMRKKYGDVVNLAKIPNFGNFLLLFNVRDIEWMLRNEGPYPKRMVLPSSKVYRHEMRKDRFGTTYGLLNGQMEDWGSFRSVVNPIMMQPRVTTQYIPELNQIADEFLAHVTKYKDGDLHGEMPADFLQEIYKWAFESIVYIALDTRLGCLGRSPSEKSQKAMKYIEKMLKLSTDLDLNPLGVVYKKFHTKTWRDYVKYQDFFTELALEMIDEVDRRLKSEPDKPEHEKSVFEKLVVKDKKIAMVMTLDMLAAGIETTGKATGAALYFLAKNKPAQTKLRNELAHLLPSKDTVVTKTILESTKYLKATIKESLRLSPIAHSTVRTTTKDMVIGGYRVPRDVTVMMPHIYLSTGTDEHFSNPTEFKPERWLRDGEQNENANAFAYLPFGFGARSCIGKRMAQMEIEIIIAKMVRNFYLDWTHKDMSFKQEMVYGIADPLKIRLKSVEN